MGGIFFFNPYFYASLEGANFENIAWLRNLGAALISVNGIGALLAASDPKKEKRLYDIVLIALTELTGHSQCQTFDHKDF